MSNSRYFLEEQADAIFNEILSFLWTRQVDEEQVQKRRIVARNWISASIELGGLNIPHPRNVVKELQMNLVQKLFRKEMSDRDGDTKLLQEILDSTLMAIGRPTILEHASEFGPKQWEKNSISTSKA